ncbi:hypothetical protein ElyMa_005934600 [Elysia marginata]|uniref:Uncharacterized protein n=1 Tax=Elysia marginata TaxID=1093978 RepID=A0AAV4G955_9GAST|nr:hypothetical protein ElyMa_005934600 [Elysia marginata]
MRENDNDDEDEEEEEDKEEEEEQQQQQQLQQHNNNIKRTQIFFMKMLRHAPASVMRKYKFSGHTKTATATIVRVFGNCK